MSFMLLFSYPDSQSHMHKAELLKAYLCSSMVYGLPSDVLYMSTYLSATLLYHKTMRLNALKRISKLTECIMQGRERKSIYIAPFILHIVSKRSDIDHTVYLPITPCLPFIRKRSPDGATPNCGSRHPIAAYYSFINP